MKRILRLFDVLLDYLKGQELKALTGLSICTWLDLDELALYIEQLQGVSLVDTPYNRGLCTAYGGALTLALITDIEVGFLASRCAVAHLPSLWWSTDRKMDQYNVWRLFALKTHRDTVLSSLRQQTHHPLFMFMGQQFTSLFDKHVIALILSTLENLHHLTSGYVRHMLLICMAHLSILQSVIHGCDGDDYLENIIQLFLMAKKAYRSSIPARVGLFVSFRVVGDTKTAASWERSVSKYIPHNGVYHTYGFVL
jgi:hypothetical protein